MKDWTDLLGVHVPAATGRMLEDLPVRDEAVRVAIDVALERLEEACERDLLDPVEDASMMLVEAPELFVDQPAALMVVGEQRVLKRSTPNPFPSTTAFPWGTYPALMAAAWAIGWRLCLYLAVFVVSFVIGSYL